MAKKTCPACGAPVSPGEEFCSYCGALIPRNQAAAQSAAAQAVQSAPAAQSEQTKRRVQTPRTIEELAAFCERHELPLAKMRFFIGLDYPGAKAFGIYKDKNGEFVVYKNKADGSRAVRYRGPDEAYAVNEIFQKLKEEASSQRARVASARKVGYPESSAHESNPYNDPDRAKAQRSGSKRRSNKLLLLILGLAAAITIGRTAAAVNKPSTPSTGYYHYNNNYYYFQNDDWYLYDDYGSWFPVYTIDSELTDNFGDYYASYSYDEDYGIGSFSDSEYYSSYDYSSDNSGSGSSWSWNWDWDDDDSWDSSDDWDWDSDWDSDWSDWDSDW
ncbi:MAG: zinc ribbon domain-containing protein [Oscillospiraceae bacterium]|nr:zinc ribbon domain-containing protein [Oscillospiraceae bacterium]